MVKWHLESETWQFEKLNGYMQQPSRNRGIFISTTFDVVPFYPDIYLRIYGVRHFFDFWNSDWSANLHDFATLIYNIRIVAVNALVE